jgi:hypothetical protein
MSRTMLFFFDTRKRKDYGEGMPKKKRDLLDEIKDAIDRLHEIKSTKRRKEAAADLVYYIELHHEPGRAL